MATPLPDPARVHQAIEIYLAQAYPGRAIPVSVQSLLSVLRSWSGEFFKAPVFAADSPTAPTRYTLRLGNLHYPHMKLVMQKSPHGEMFLFRADTHDQHICPPPSSPEYSAFRELMERNQAIAASIEHAWVASGLPTFASYLEADLARHQGK